MHIDPIEEGGAAGGLHDSRLSWDQSHHASGITSSTAEGI